MLSGEIALRDNNYYYYYHTTKKMEEIYFWYVEKYSGTENILIITHNAISYVILDAFCK